MSWTDSLDERPTVDRRTPDQIAADRALIAGELALWALGRQPVRPTTSLARRLWEWVQVPCVVAWWLVSSFGAPLLLMFVCFLLLQGFSDVVHAVRAHQFP